MTKNLLDDLAIASPCTADWNQMTGDAKRRFCQQCKLHVHDLSAMTGAEAEALLRSAGGDRLCVRFYRRQDGTVLTQDCPVGLRQRLRQARRRAAAALSAACAALLSLVGCTRDKDGGVMGGVRPTPADTHGQPGDAPPLMGEIEAPQVEMGDSTPRPVMGKPAPQAEPRR